MNGVEWTQTGRVWAAAGAYAYGGRWLAIVYREEAFRWPPAPFSWRVWTAPPAAPSTEGMAYSVEEGQAAAWAVVAARDPGLG